MFHLIPRTRFYAFARSEGLSMSQAGGMGQSPLFEKRT